MARLLLDTHAFLWWLAGDEALTAAARDVIADTANQVFVSAASAWEIATKHRLGKLPSVWAVVSDLDAIVSDLDAIVSEQGFVSLPITIAHGRIGGTLPGPHRDPFDRMLIAQALEARLTLVSNETLFDTYGVSRVW